jgi:hypothetical protein
MVVKIGGRRMWPWRAVDDEGKVLDTLVQRRRDRHAAVYKHSTPRHTQYAELPSVLSGLVWDQTSNAAQAAEGEPKADQDKRRDTRRAVRLQPAVTAADGPETARSPDGPAHQPDPPDRTSRR